ncbi:hypothetical protein CXF36_03900 [Corynebacterium bovis]|nr:hypothetical protein CXF36_03900 [Corynebacterium bovis]
MPDASCGAASVLTSGASCGLASVASVLGSGEEVVMVLRCPSSSTAPAERGCRAAPGTGPVSHRWSGDDAGARPGTGDPGRRVRVLHTRH